jgi:D-3-phosphoglycerate dehydrogenase
MMRPKVLIASNSFGRLVDDGIRLVQGVADTERIDPMTIGEEEFSGKLKECTVTIGFPRRYGEIVSKARNLKLIAIRGAGHDTLDVEEATRNGILVTFAPAANSISVAELAVGLLLSITKKIPAAARCVSEGKWERLSWCGKEIEGKTLGIIGLGAIGSKVARIMSGFDVTILACDPYASEENAETLGVRLVSMNELLKESDFITIHCALTQSTKGIIGSQAIKEMKPTAYIINASRGEVVDEKAIAEALKADKLAGYATDVLSVEPVEPDNPLIGLDNVICTPHIGGYTREAARRVDMTVASDVVAVLEGGRPNAKRTLNPSLLGEK